MKNKRKFVIGLLIAMGAVFAGVGSVSAQTAADADFDDSGEVGFQDFLLFAAKFNTARGDANYDARFDLDDSGDVGFADFLTFARFFGETVPVPALALTGIAPSEGMPGTLIELVGQFDANTAYQVKFGTFLLPVFAQDAERITAMVPVLESGSVPVLVVDPSGRESEPTSFEVLALPEPRMNPEQLQQAVSGVGDGIGNVLAPLTAPDSLFSAADAAMIKDEMGKLNAAWGILGQRIEALPPEDAALLTHLLDNSGALGILEGLGTIDLSASKAVELGAAFRHQKLFQADVVSFLMGNASAATSAATLIAAVVPGGQALLPILAAIDAVSGVTKTVIDAIFPTDLENLRVEISPTPVAVEGASDVSYYGDFVTESDAIRALGDKLLEGAVEELLDEFLKIPKVSEKAAEEIVGFVTGILTSAGMKGFDWALRGATISPALKDVPLDMSVYRLSIFDVLQVVPTLPGKETADAIEYLLGKAGIDVTFFDPVVVENEAVAAYDKLNARLTGKTAGATRLTVRAIRFVEWDSWWNWLGICVWETVGPVYQNINVGTTSTSPPFDLDSDNTWPHGITYVNNRFYVVDDRHDKVFAYTVSGQRDAASEFDLNDENGSPKGITYANNRFYVIDSWPDDKVFAYTVSGQRDAASEFDLNDENGSPKGITYADNRFYVVDSWHDKVFAYTVSGQRDAASDFDLDSGRAYPRGMTHDNDQPAGITYANNRFYVVDDYDAKVYVYTVSGQRDVASEFDLNSDSRTPHGITYANDRFYVVDYSVERIFVYKHSGQYRARPDLVAQSSTSEGLLTPGQSFTLSATVENVGDAQASSTMLRYYYSDDWSISQNDTLLGSAAVGVLNPSDRSLVNVTLTAPSAVGTYYYRVYADVVDGEEITYNNPSVASVVSVSSETPATTGFSIATNVHPTSITYANDRFYVADLLKRKIFAYMSSGERDEASDFGVNVASYGITYANDRFFVAGPDTVYAYTVSGQRDAASDLPFGSNRLTGITYANDRFYVVHDYSDKAIAYTSLGQRDSRSDFSLQYDGPAGITYANGQFYVANNDLGGGWQKLEVHAYGSSGGRAAASDFVPRYGPFFDTFSGGITYANDRFYIVSAGKVDKLGDEVVRAYSSSGGRHSASDFRLELTLPNGIAYGNNRFYVADDSRRVLVYTNSGTRDAASDFLVRYGNPTGITYANNRLYVVHRNSSTVSVYTRSGQLESDSGFRLSSNNDKPAGITYGNHRFYVIDDNDNNTRTFVYTRSGEYLETFDTDRALEPGGITYVNGKLYVPDTYTTYVYTDLGLRDADSEFTHGFQSTGIAYTDNRLFVVGLSYGKVSPSRGWSDIAFGGIVRAYTLSGQ